MKRTLPTVLLLFSLTVTGFTQTLSGEYTNTRSSAMAYYTKIKWEVSYMFEEKNGNFYIRFYNPKIKVPNYSLYHDEFDKEYSLADLNLASWPSSRQRPFAMSVKVSISDGYNNYESSASCNSDFTCESNYIASKANLKNVTLQNFRVTAAGNFSANLDGEPAVDNILKQKRLSGNKPSNIVGNSSSSSGSSSSGNSVSGSNENASSGTSGQATTTPNNTGTENPAYILKYSDVGIPQNTPSQTKQEITTQVVTQAASLAGELLNDWNAASERKQKNREIENNEKWDRIDRRARSRFEFYYDKLIDLANNGDENAQMILYLESEGNYGGKAIPLREKWFKKALENKNPTAILAEINNSDGDPPFGTVYETNKEILHSLADSGNIDAMVMLGLWYSQKKNKSVYFFRHQIYGTSHGHLKGGENEELAMKYLTMAAEKGSPNAMYYLAMVYLNGKTLDNSYFIKFNIEKNEKLAFEWLQKSITPNYRESIYQAHNITYLYWEGSCFEEASYYVLATMYEKGKIVPKDIVLAAELRQKGAERSAYVKSNRGQVEKF